MVDTRIPPHAVDAEQSVLGAIMQDRQALTKALSLLCARDFYVPRHRHIFEHVTALNDAGIAVDLITLSQSLEDAGIIDDIGGRRYLMNLTDSVLRFTNIEDHCNIVRNASRRNILIARCSETINNLYNADLPLEHITERYQSALEEIKDKSSTNIITMSDNIASRIEELKKIQKGEVKPGLSSGITELDNIINGFCPGDIIVIGAWPNIGKTAFVLNIIDHVIVSERTPVLMFELEMTKEKIIDRMICSRANVPSRSIKQKEAVIWSNFDAVEEAYANAASFYIIDDAALTIKDIQNRASQVKDEHDIGLVVVDNLQLVVGPESESRRGEIDKISQGIKALGKDLRIPVIAISHLRKPENGSRRKPNRHDLKESGALEADPDVVILIHRDEDKWGIYSDEAEVMVVKNRDGETGHINMRYNGALTRFEKPTSNNYSEINF